jgi:hypothetical protein
MPFRSAKCNVSPRPATGWRLLRRAPAAGALMATALLAAGCGDNADKFAPPCPSLALLKDAADMTRFDAHGHDVTDMEVSARLVAVPASCQPGADARHVAAKIQVAMSLTRGPALVGRTVTVPYLVTVAEGNNIIDQKAYSITTTFAANVDQMNVTDAEIPMAFPITRQKSAAAYTIYVSFRLTPDQLAYNRAHASADAAMP